MGFDSPLSRILILSVIVSVRLFTICLKLLVYLIDSMDRLLFLIEKHLAFSGY